MIKRPVQILGGDLFSQPENANDAISERCCSRWIWETLKKKKKTQICTCLNMPNANIGRGMQMLGQKIVVGLFPLYFWFWTLRGKNVFVCRKTCVRKSKYLPFNPLEEKFTILASVKAGRKNLSTFRATKSCPRCGCLWLLYLSTEWGLQEGNWDKWEQARRNTTRVCSSRHSPEERKGRKGSWKSVIFWFLREYLCLLP